jgi:hypothetical protein
MLQDDVLDETLKALGVEYSHANEELLRPSHIEEQRTNAALQVWMIQPTFVFSVNAESWKTRCADVVLKILLNHARFPVNVTR